MPLGYMQEGQFHHSGDSSTCTAPGAVSTCLLYLTPMSCPSMGTVVPLSLVPHLRPPSNGLSRHPQVPSSPQFPVHSLLLCLLCHPLCTSPSLSPLFLPSSISCGQRPSASHGGQPTGGLILHPMNPPLHCLRPALVMGGPFHH